MNYSTKLKDPRWQKKRLEILQRDDWMCQHCGDKESPLNIHHISYSYEPWDVDNELLITLCEDCHKREQIEVYEEGKKLIIALKNMGFMSMGMNSLQNVFKTDRGWKNYDPVFDILKMIIDDNELWGYLSELFWKRLKEQNKNNK